MTSSLDQPTNKCLSEEPSEMHLGELSAHPSAAPAVKLSLERPFAHPVAATRSDLTILIERASKETKESAEEEEVAEPRDSARNRHFWDAALDLPLPETIVSTTIALQQKEVASELQTLEMAEPWNAATHTDSSLEEPPALFDLFPASVQAQACRKGSRMDRVAKPQEKELLDHKKKALRPVARLCVHEERSWARLHVPQTRSCI